MHKSQLTLFMMLSQITICCKAEVMADEATRLQVAVEQVLRQPVVFESETVPTFSVLDRLSFYKVPGLSFALIDNGKVSWSNGYGNLS